MSIEIVQDSECDDGEVGPPLPVFWTRGHGHDAGDLIRAVFDHCLEYGVDVPAIPWDVVPEETWQRNVVLQGAVEYLRDPAPPTSGRSDRFPITVLDLSSTGRGGTKCGVDNCSEPWSSGAPVRVLIGADEPYMAVRMWFCRKHTAAFPEPSYRVFMVPVGATVELPENEVSR